MGTTNTDLQKLARKNGFTLHIYTRDDLPYLQNRHKYKNIIVNLDKEGQTHWTALHIRDKVAYYFDSFSMPPPMNIIHYCKNLKLDVNPIRIQHLNSTKCGEFCIFMLKEFNRRQTVYPKRTFQDIFRKFDNNDYKKNDLIVMNFI